MILLSVLILAFLVEVSSQQNFNFTDTGEWRVRGADVESDRDEIPHIQGKRNPSKMVGTERGHGG